MSTQMIGRYEVIEKLGQGGMAQVFLARDPYMKRQVAIKVMWTPNVTDDEFEKRFLREAEVIAGLEHPFIVPVYDFGYFGKQPYLVMRYLKGGSLKERIEDYGAMTLPNVAKIMERLASALDVAHQQGIIHRDLKPDNVLLDQQGDTYLTDFGIVKILGGGSAGGSTGMWIAGTPAYMSPEQVSGDYPVTSRSDVYSLGVTLYELISGKQPYRDSLPTKLMMRHVLDPVPSLNTVMQDVPAGIEAVLQKAMAKDPADRYPTAGAFSEAVNGAARAVLTRRARRRFVSDELSDALDALDEDDTKK